MARQYDITKAPSAVGGARTRTLWTRGEPRVWLDLDEAGVAALHARLGAGAAIGRETAHYDTPDLVLRRAGMTLAIERRGQRFVQVVTFPLHADTAERLVHEAEAFGRGPDRRHLLAVLPPDLAVRVSEAPLERLFALRFTRVQAGFPATVPVLDAVLDRGVVIVGTTETTFAELSLRNCPGVVAVHAAAHLLADIPVRLAAEDRWERGYRIAAGHAPQPYHARVAPVPADASLGEAAERVLRQAFEHFIRNLPAASLRGETEAIHQMRVGMRRLTACAAIFPRLLDPELIRDVGDLRQLFESLAEVRECDVFLDSTLPDVSLGAVSAVDRSGFEVAVRLHRASALGSLRRAFDGRDLAVLVSSLALRLDGSGWSARRQPLDEFTAKLGASEFAVRRIRALHRRLLAAEPGDRHDVAGWHAARKRAKQLRYATEPLRLAYPAKAKATQVYAHRLAQLQDVLGDLNDLRTAGDLMGRLDVTAAAELGTPMRVIRGAVCAHIENHTRRLLPKATRALDRVRAAYPKPRRHTRRPFVVAVIGEDAAPVGWIAAQVAAAWAAAGLRTAFRIHASVPAAARWLAARDDELPRIARLGRLDLATLAERQVQRLAIARTLPRRAKAWRQLDKRADVIVLVVGEGVPGTDAVAAANRNGITPLVVTVAAQPGFDAVATLRWRKAEQTQMQRGAGPFHATRDSEIAAQSAWLPLLAALERWPQPWR